MSEKLTNDTAPPPAPAIPLAGTSAPGTPFKVAGTITGRELLLAGLVWAVVTSLFLAPALFTGRFLSPADLLFEYYPWRAEQPPGWTSASNLLLIDSVSQLEPWITYTAQRLQNRTLPLWDPNNYLGTPFIGNMQSAVFFPLNWPAFLWPAGPMLLVRAWLKLFIAGLGMYLLARNVIRLSPLGAAVATPTFAFSAFMIVWLLHAHTAVVIWLPWLWWATAQVVAQPGARRAAVLAALVALHLLAGHPETAYHVAGVTGLFALFRIWQTGPLVPRRVVTILGWWGAAYGVGAGIAAVQLLPFLEYSDQSMALLRRTERQGTPFWLPFYYAWTAISPDLYGNPARHNWWGVYTNYNESNTYNGVLPLLLAPFALRIRDRAQRQFAIFLLVLLLLTMGVIYNWPVVFQVAMTIPGMRFVLNNRLLLVVAAALAILAGIGMEAVCQEIMQRRRRLLTTAVVVTGVLLILGVGIPAIFAHGYFQVPLNSALANQVWDAGLVRAAALLLMAVLLIALVCAVWARRPRLGRILLLSLPLLLFADLWQAHSDYVPTVAPANYFPSTPALRFLQQQQGLFRVVAAPWVLMPNTNVPYGISSLRGYDALDPQLYYQLVFRPALKQDSATSLQPTSILNLVNVRYLLTVPGDDPTVPVDVRQDASNGLIVGEITGSNQPGQTFTAQSDSLTEIQVLGATYGGHARGRLIFHLKTRPSDAADLITRELDAAALKDNQFWSITFPPILHTRGRSFYFYLEAPEARSGQATTLWYSRADAYPGGTRMANGRPVDGDLTFRTIASGNPADPWFIRVFDGGSNDVSIYENRHVVPRAWLTHQVEVQPNADARVARLADSAFDAKHVAVLSTPLPAGESVSVQPSSVSSDSVTIGTYQPELIRISTHSSAPGLLILSDQAFPGWRAEVDGTPTAILTADHALRGVYVPAGEHRVSYYYEPDSFRHGAILSIGALLVLAIMAAWPRGGMIPRLRSRTTHPNM